MMDVKRWYLPRVTIGGLRKGQTKTEYATVFKNKINMVKIVTSFRIVTYKLS